MLSSKGSFLATFGFSVKHLNSQNCSMSCFQGLNQGTKNKLSVIGTAALNLAEFTSVAEGKDLEINVPLSLLGAQAEHNPSLCVSAVSFFTLNFYVQYFC